MLIFGGIILDKMGVRFTGKMATIIMVIGTAIKYWAISTHSLDGINILGMKAQVVIAGWICNFRSRSGSCRYNSFKDNCKMV